MDFCQSSSDPLRILQALSLIFGTSMTVANAVSILPPDESLSYENFLVRMKGIFKSVRRNSSET
jgi:hypothetical protein